MIDESAFGILFSYFSVEDDEYGLERSEFVDRFQLFRNTMRAGLRELPLGQGARALDLGHAHYVEVADGDQSESPLGWAKKVRQRLTEGGFVTVVVVTHGGRWVDEADPSFFSTEHVGDFGLLTLSNPSEPLRRALYADTACRPDDDCAIEGWGPGIYLDLEAVEALGIKPKNAPTIIRSGGAAFFRVGA
jgi:hypothetical protein